MAQHFLQQKKLVPLEGCQLDTLRTVRIALLFCLPVLKLGLDWLDGFHEVLIYPEPFNVDRLWQDEHGLVHHAPAVHAGQSWTQGPVVLNWLDIQDSFDLSGYNLVIHEVAHKLDARGSGYTSGVPMMPLREVAQWEKDLRSAMAGIEHEVESVGEQAASIDPYAASDPAECFAVLSEYFYGPGPAGAFPGHVPSSSALLSAGPVKQNRSRSRLNRLLCRRIALKLAS